MLYFRTRSRVQRLTVCLVYIMYSSYVSPTKLSTAAGLETLQEERRMNHLKFLYLIVSDELGIDTDDYIAFFCPRSTRHFHSRTMKPYSCKNNSFKYFFFPQTIIDWNSLPLDVVHTTNFLDFCSKLLQQVQSV
uniref:Putative endonuclease/reverse transcriptase n=1 Tax=Ixodes ricinus TaxID=34613 RepID=A0A090XF61_IXORI